jgi:hypothetical protein
MADDKHSDSVAEFYLKEYESLRKEIEWLGKDERALERNVTVAIGLIWVWLLKDGSNVTRLAWLIPVLLALLGAVRAIQLERYFKQYFNIYIGLVEAYFSRPGTPKGWENFLKSRQKHPVLLSVVLFWVILLLSTVFAAVWRFDWFRSG